MCGYIFLAFLFEGDSWSRKKIFGEGKEEVVDVLAGFGRCLDIAVHAKFEGEVRGRPLLLRLLWIMLSRLICCRRG